MNLGRPKDGCGKLERNKHVFKRFESMTAAVTKESKRACYSLLVVTGTVGKMKVAVRRGNLISIPLFFRI